MIKILFALTRTGQTLRSYYTAKFSAFSLFAKPPNMNFISEILIALRITYSKKQPGLRSKDIDKS
jgi:hypothetical protein